MARADRRRAERARPAAESSRYDSAYVGTDALFFQRLRRQAKWMFVFLALVFGVGFVAFGVGSDVQGGIADALRGAGGTAGGPSVGEAREKVAASPNNPRALRQLATALIADDKQEEAARVLERYVQLRPNDADALRDLAGLYLAKGSRLRNQVTVLQYQLMEFQTASLVAPSLVPEGQSPTAASGGDPIRQALEQRVNDRYNKLYVEVQGTYERAKRVYQKLAGLAPSDPNVQIELGQAAQEAGDVKTAVAAYKRFLKLAPGDPAAPTVRGLVEALQKPTPSPAAR